MAISSPKLRIRKMEPRRAQENVTASVTQGLKNRILDWISFMIPVDQKHNIVVQEDYIVKKKKSERNTRKLIIQLVQAIGQLSCLLTHTSYSGDIRKNKM